ncbi:hypothetical protein [Stappia sp. ES.058]|uniref:hypothetical protein n=1 Tax=Stappia sp. ES.058 TaxID=1881061 RepID=UPI00087AB524|nr:hypothetical protein [Stappia sp. ES.058]SDU14957.1 hypothetical protein SAMN05428979_1933 [Stappia sp. ES.058]
MSRRRSPPLTPEMAAEIKAMGRDTDLMQHEIAAHLNVNQGRVSEVLSGKRFPEVRPS